jgi:phosphoserine phosphatase RsbX
MRIRVAHKVEAYPGETESGDAVVTHLAEGCSMLAVIDGLGHGPAAARAATAAAAALHAKRGTSDLMAMMHAMHADLQGTRGAAATVCLFDGARFTCCGVGNVALRTDGTDIPFVLSPGILGKGVRRFRIIEATLVRGLRIVLHSDGIASHLAMASLSQLGTEEACAAIFRNYRKQSDDGAAMVIDVGE